MYINLKIICKECTCMCNNNTLCHHITNNCKVVS